MSDLPPDVVNRLSDLYLTSWDLSAAATRLGALGVNSVLTEEERASMERTRVEVLAIKDRVDEERRALRSPAEPEDQSDGA